MADKSVPQLNQITTINDTDLYHVVRNNIDYKITGGDIKKAISPYYEWTAFLSQFASVSSYTSGLLTGGAFYYIDSYNSGDDFSNLELVSGTMNTNGALLRATTLAPNVWTNGSSLENTLDAYISGTNSITGKYEAVVNTWPSTFPYPSGIDWSKFMYDGVGLFYITFPFGAGQTYIQIGSGNPSTFEISSYADGSSIWINTNVSGTPTDGLLNFTPISIKLYYTPV